MNLSEKLVKGSRVLNQQRNEILDVLKILCGLLSARARQYAVYEFLCPDRNYWNIAQDVEAKKTTIIISFMNRDEETLLQTPNANNVTKDCSMRDIAVIHKNLDVLIDGLNERYPEMLRPLFEAVTE